MDLSHEPSPDEGRIIERPLYRAGQTKPAPKPAPAAPVRSIAKPSVPPPKRLAQSASEKPPLLQRRLVRAVLVALWLLLLTGVSYCVFLPDPIDEARREMRAVFRDKDLTWEQKREKMDKIISGLSDRQRRDFRMSPERRVKIHDDLDAFFKLPKDQQDAQLRKEILEFEKRRAEWRAWRAKNGGGPGGRGGQGKGGQGKGGQGGGPRGGGFMRGGGDPTGGDLLPPETRQQMGLKFSRMREMRAKMGLGGGRGGPGGGGGRGGPGRQIQ